MASIIGVETLQHTNGTTAATIDSSGRILTPKRPSFQAYNTTSTNFTTSGVQQTLIFSNTAHNEGNCFNTTTGAFTTPVAGLYFFSLCARFDNCLSTSYVRLMVTYETDNSPWNDPDKTIHVIQGVPDTNYFSLSCSGALYVPANTQVFAKGGHNTDTSYTFNLESHFSGFLVG
jgi:hypothetical protein